jgi:hypothetical protein
MDDEVQGVVDQLFKKLAAKGYDFRIEVSWQKDGLRGRIIHVPMPKRHGLR